MSCGSAWLLMLTALFAAGGLLAYGIARLECSLARLTKLLEEREYQLKLDLERRRA